MRSARDDHQKAVRNKQAVEQSKSPAARAELEKAHNMAFIEYRGQRIHVDDLPDATLTTDDLKHVPMTTYAREKIPPKLDDETLIQTAEKYAKQVTQIHHPAVTYEEALLHTILPELIKRLKDKPTD